MDKPILSQDPEASGLEAKQYGLKGSKRIQIICCSGTGCHALGGMQVLAKLKSVVAEYGLDEQVDVGTTGCFGFCAKGPIVRVLPDNITYIQVKRSDVREIIRSHIMDGAPVSRLLYVDNAVQLMEQESQHWSSFKRPVSLDSMLQHYIYEIGGRRYLNVLSYAVAPNKCKGCGACKRNCPAQAIEGTVRQPHVINSYKCTCCGKCTEKCKFDAIYGPIGILDERNSIADVLADIANPDKVVVAQTAPAVRYALGEEFGMEPGTIVTGKMISALREIGFDYVFDTNFGADFTIMEESAEFVHRLKRHMVGDKLVKLPMTTSCCPAWVNFFENDYPDLRDYPSTCKSPAQMFGAIIKTYWAEKMGLSRERITVVSIMPCMSKKYECARDEFMVNNNPDVDCSITTLELAKLIRRQEIDFEDLPDGQFDSPLGNASGAATIFGTTGGVTEAVLRTAYEKFTGKSLPQVEFMDVRGMDGIREATIDMNGFKLKVCVLHTLSNARILMDKLRAGELDYHLVEVMSCPGGCIGGTGQPYHHGDVEVLQARQQAMYSDDVAKHVRKSHENLAVRRIYTEYLGKPLGERAHRMLHTKFRDKSILHR